MVKRWNSGDDGGSDADDDQCLRPDKAAVFQVSSGCVAPLLLYRGDCSGSRLRWKEAAATAARVSLL